MSGCACIFRFAHRLYLENEDKHLVATRVRSNALIQPDASRHLAVGMNHQRCRWCDAG